MFSIDDIYLYIFCWNKVVDNSCLLYTEISATCPNTTIINCDETRPLDADKYRSIQLDDSYYYGGQFEAAIKAIPPGKVMACITGDVRPGGDWQGIIDNTVKYLNRGDIGIIAPNVIFTPWEGRGEHVVDDLWQVGNTDCTFWFLHPRLVELLGHFEYRELSNYGWGIDKMWIAESLAQKMLVVRDYSQTIYQPNTTGYNKWEANSQMKELLMVYNEYKALNTN